jgi:hypothetical protein
MKFPFPIAEITCAEVVPMCSLCLFPASVRSSVQKWDLHSLYSLHAIRKLIQFTTLPIRPHYVNEKSEEKNMQPDSQIQYMVKQSNYVHKKTDLASSRFY